MMRRKETCDALVTSSKVISLPQIFIEQQSFYLLIPQIVFLLLMLLRRLDNPFADCLIPFSMFSAYNPSFS